MNVPPSEERFILGPFDKWLVKSEELKKSLEPESSYQGFVELLKTSGLDKYTEELLDALAFIYTVGEVPVQVSVFTKY